MAKKLRSACDFCHQTKVKCSGGNPCNGCAQLSIDCVYSASNRIGRPKGSRNKKTIERVKRYKQENEERQKAQMAENAARQQAAAAAVPPPQIPPPEHQQQRHQAPPPTHHAPAHHSHHSSSRASPVAQNPPPMTVDWTSSPDKHDDLFSLACESEATVGPVDPVYSIYTGDMNHEFPELDFTHSAADTPLIADTPLTAAPMFHDVNDATSFPPFISSEEMKGISRVPAAAHPTGPSSSVPFSAPDAVRSLSITSTPFASPQTTPALSTSSSVVSASSPSSCTCLQDLASLLSRLASLKTAPVELDTALESAQQAIRTWDCFLRCRPCSFRMFASKFDSYLVLTSSMRIILGLLSDQLGHFDSPATAGRPFPMQSQLAAQQAIASSQQAAGQQQQGGDGSGSAMTPTGGGPSISAHERRGSRQWMFGMYETSLTENQLISATLLSKIAGSIVTLSARMSEITGGASSDSFMLDFTSAAGPAGGLPPPGDAAAAAAALTPGGALNPNNNPLAKAAADPSGCAYLIDHDMDDTAAGFNLKFLHQKACTNDSLARRFREEINARVRNLV